MKRLLLLLLSLCLPAAARAAAPLPAGAVLSAVTLSDLSDRPVPLSSYAGKVVVLLYEDRDADGKNQAFKDQLGKLWERHRDALVIVAAAEVSRYDFWPARRYVKDALRKLAGGDGFVVLVDWKGALKRRFALKAGQSTFLACDQAGRLRLGKSGDLSAAESAQALGEIERLLP